MILSNTARLLEETPTTRRQASLASAYRGWLQFKRNRLALAGLIAVCVLGILSIAAPLFATHGPNGQDLSNRLAFPSTEHWLGTDELGRDVYSRLLYGGRATLGIVLAVVVMVAPVGILIGATAGYAGGIFDKVLMRITDVFLAFPALVLALAFVAALRPGLTSAVIAIALTTWPPIARLARAETLAIRNADFIVATRMVGASPIRIILRHVVPICAPSVIVRLALATSAIIMTAAGLGFLGMGAQPPLPEWGTMIATTRAYVLEQWWVPLAPGMAILVTSLALNLVADGLRDVLDPRQD